MVPIKIRELIAPARNGYIRVFEQPEVLLLVNPTSKILVWSFASAWREVRVLIQLIKTVEKGYLAGWLPY